MERKTALITGITGQDGSYLAEFLLEKGYEVHGTIRRSSVDYRERIAHLEGHSHFHLHYADLSDSMSILGVVGQIRPTEIYNLAAQSHVQVSFDSPEFTADVDAVGVLRVLEAVRQLGLTDSCRIYQASTSELYGKVEEVPQNENTPFHPYSPYAVAKQYGFWIVREYRDAYNMFCCSGILFNHESERRGETFVTRKITLAAARIKQGKQDKLLLGNLSSLRDWGYAKDYVECMSSSLRAYSTVCASSVTMLSSVWASNWSSRAKASTRKALTRPREKCSLKSVPTSIARRMSSICGATPPRPRPNWAGIPTKRALRNSSTSWSIATWPKWLQRAQPRRCVPIWPNTLKKASLNSLFPVLYFTHIRFGICVKSFYIAVR